MFTPKTGRLSTERWDALAETVCDNDPRSRNQRRADACGPLARGEATMACQCGLEYCPADEGRKAAQSAVIHVLAEQSTLDGNSDNPGYLPGFGVLPAASVREVAKTAQLKFVKVPTAHTTPDPGYRPRSTTKDFLRRRSDVSVAGM